MATPLYKFLKGNSPLDESVNGGATTYVFPSASEDVSQQNQNDNYNVKFTKVALLNIDLNKMDLENTDEFNTESFQVLTEKSDLLVNHLRNYVANHETTIRESLINNNNSFYDPTELSSVTEKVFWKWMRKTGAMEFEPAIPNQEYIDTNEFAVDENLDSSYFNYYSPAIKASLLSSCACIM